MTAFNFDDSTNRKIATGSIFDLAKNLAIAQFVRLSRWWEMRRAINQLSRASDEMLHDIGVTRSGIEDAVRYGRR